MVMVWARVQTFRGSLSLFFRRETDPVSARAALLFQLREGGSGVESSEPGPSVEMFLESAQTGCYSEDFSEKFPDRAETTPFFRSFKRGNRLPRRKAPARCWKNFAVTSRR